MEVIASINRSESGVVNIGGHSKHNVVMIDGDVTDTSRESRNGSSDGDGDCDECSG